MKRIILLVAIVAVLAGAAAYFVLVPNATQVFGSRQVITDKKAIAKATLGFVQNPYADDYNVMRIPGWVENQSDKRIVSADLAIQLLDGDGNRKELVKYTVTDIPPHGRKSFDANGGAFAGPRKSVVEIVRLEVVD